MRGEVIVPDAVVHRLEVPHTLTCFRLETNEALGEQIVPMSVTTVVIVREAWELASVVEVGARRGCGNGIELIRRTVEMVRS